MVDKPTALLGLCGQCLFGPHYNKHRHFWTTSSPGWWLWQWYKWFWKQQLQCQKACLQRWSLKWNMKTHRQTAPGTSFINIQTNEAFKASVLRDCPKLFDGRIGLMKGEVSIALCEDSVPCQAPIWCVTQSMGALLKVELGCLVSKRILMKMTLDKPSDWLNSIVCLQKPNRKIPFVSWSHTAEQVCCKTETYC